MPERRRNPLAISKDYIQDLHDRLDIEDVVSDYVSLKRTGKNLKGLCPFHSEKTPSFTVFPDTKSFYCFGCGAGGDVISFLMRIDSLDYVEAVKACAERAGMSMPDEGYDDSLSRLRQRILSANREAARFYNKQLFKPENRHALNYFLQRGLTVETIQHFGLGYAPDDWQKLTDHLKSLGFNENELLQADLIKRSSKTNRPYDNFRNRVMFPIFDLRNNVVAFGGRIIDEKTKGVGKYVNTADTPVYKKGNGVFALNFAKNTPGKQLILVEGYMDVIALHQAGITNAIACLGTAFTSEMANLLSRYADEILICYDNDEAGRKATARALEILGRTGMNLKVIKMEGGKDADEIIRTYGADRFLSLIGKAYNETEYQLFNERQKYALETDDGKLRYLNAAAQILSECKDLEADIYTSRLSEEFGVAKESLKSQIALARAANRKRRRTQEKRDEAKMLTASFDDKNNPERRNNLKAASAEETLLASLMRNPDHFRFVKERISPDDFVTGFNKRVAAKLFELLEGGYSTDYSMFAEDFSPSEMDSIVKISNLRDKLANTEKECEDCIKVIKNNKPGEKVETGELSDEDYLNLFKNLNKGEKKDGTQ